MENPRALLKIAADSQTRVLRLCARAGSVKLLARCKNTLKSGALKASGALGPRIWPTSHESTGGWRQHIHPYVRYAQTQNSVAGRGLLRATIFASTLSEGSAAQVKHRAPSRSKNLLTDLIQLQL